MTGRVTNNKFMINDTLLIFCRDLSIKPKIMCIW